MIAQGAFVVLAKAKLLGAHTDRYEVESWDQDWEEVEKADAGAVTTGLARSE